MLDRWLEIKFPSVTFVRYADDVVIHCRTETQAITVLAAIKARLNDCKLRLNEEKTKIAYCKDYRRTQQNNYPKSFDFLGFRFKPMSKESKQGGMFLGFDCCISIKSRTRLINKWKTLDFHRHSNHTLQSIANLHWSNIKRHNKLLCQN